jgi:hypothetical protein
MRNELLIRIHLGKAFWWLPSFDEQLWLHQGNDLSQSYILRLLGISFAELICPIHHRGDLSLLNLKNMDCLEGRQMFVVEPSDEPNALYFGMFDGPIETPETLASMALRKTLEHAHSSYPSPVPVRRFEF